MAAFNIYIAIMHALTLCHFQVAISQSTVDPRLVLTFWRLQLCGPPTLPRWLSRIEDARGQRSAQPGLELARQWRWQRQTTFETSPRNDRWIERISSPSVTAAGSSSSSSRTKLYQAANQHLSLSTSPLLPPFSLFIRLPVSFALSVCSCVWIDHWSITEQLAARRARTETCMTSRLRCSDVTERVPTDRPAGHT